LLREKRKGRDEEGRGGGGVVMVGDYSAGLPDSTRGS